MDTIIKRLKKKQSPKKASKPYGSRPNNSKKSHGRRPIKHKDLSTKEMKRVLIQRFGLQCWGCDFIAPRDQYLQMDHIDPKSMGGSNTLDNIALLCAPCNGIKSNTKTLVGLRLENLRKGFAKKDPHPIDILKARQWARKYLQGEI